MAAEKRSEVMSRTSIERRSERELVITRTFRAPARIVFDAFTRPEHVRRWWAPLSLGVTVVSVDVDLRPGGAYRYVLQPPGGESIAFLVSRSAARRARTGSRRAERKPPRRGDPRAAGRVEIAGTSRGVPTDGSWVAPRRARDGAIGPLG